MPWVVQRTDDFQASQHAEDAIKAAAVGLGIEVAADADGRALVVGAGAAGEHIAHLVDGQGESGVGAPRSEEIAGGFVLIAEGEAVAAAIRGGADLRHLHDAVP